MSAEKKHDYHLVDPSPWPIYVSFSCLVLAIGSVYYLHNEVSWGMYLGLALLLYGAYMWFRDVVIEAEHQGHHTPVVQIHHRYGMTLFIASEVMFFVAWFWAYFDISLFPNVFVGSVWPPQDIETLDDETVEIQCPPEVFNAVVNTLIEADMAPESSEVLQKPTNEVALSDDDAEKVTQAMAMMAGAAMKGDELETLDVRYDQRGN